MKIQNAIVKNISPEINIVFVKQTKITVVEKMEDEQILLSIGDLLEKRGLCLSKLILIKKNFSSLSARESADQQKTGPAGSKARRDNYS